MERLQKVIANSGYCSRRKAEELIQKGKVIVNDIKVTELGFKVSGSDKISIDGKMLSRDEKEYYLLYKPRGIITSTKDEKNRKTVVDLIETDKRIYPVGRLDYDTTGILLLTNDGNLANKLMHPSSNIEKVYIAKVQGILSGYDIKRLKNGVIVDGYKTSKARVKLKSIDKDKNTCLVEITIHEGKNHQVKKMIEAVGKKVLKLRRERYAFFDLTGLKVGEYRRLSNKEIAVIYSMVK